MLYRTLLAFCLFCNVAFAGIQVEETYKPYEPIEITCEVSSENDTEVIYEWTLPEELQTRSLDNNQRLYAWAAPNTYEIECTAVVQHMAEVETLIRDKEDPTNPAKFEYKILRFVVKIDVQKFSEKFTVGPDPCDDVSPDPVDPDPVDPDPVDPDPIDDDVIPTPVNDPISATGFHVLILEETGNRPSLPKDQKYILMSTIVRNTVVTKYNGHFRVTDPDSPLNFEHPRWKEAIERPRTKLPWIIVSNDKTWYEGPLPDNMDATLALIEKHKPR